MNHLWFHEKWCATNYLVQFLKCLADNFDNLKFQDASKVGIDETKWTTIDRQNHSVNFMQFTFNILQVTLTQKIITRRVFENFTYGCEGICMSEGKFIKPWQVTDKIIECIFMQFTLNILWVTLTQKIITRRVFKIHKWIWGDLYEWGKVD